jgi:hypothetical protein
MVFQGAVQAAGFVSGLVIIRLLSKEQYAYYTISFTVASAMSVLGDSGLTSSVLAQGGRVWRDRMRLGSVLRTGLSMRRVLVPIAAVIGIPAQCLMLQRQGADVGTIAGLAAATTAQFLATSSSSLLEVVPRLHQRLWGLQITQLLSNLGRAVAVVAVVPFWPQATFAVGAAVIPSWIGNFRLRNLAARDADLSAPSDESVRTTLIGQVKRTLPDSAYYAAAGQITTWLAALVAAHGAVATIGALGRLAMLVSIQMTTFHVAVLPRFARLPDGGPKALSHQYWKSQGLVLIACLVPLTAFIFFPGLLLRLIGPTYAGLEREAFLMALGATAATMAGVAFHLGASRGIVIPPVLAIGGTLTAQVMLLAVLPIQTIQGAILLGLLSSTVQWALYTGYYLVKAPRQAR